jgi:hypothetical protein
MTFSPDARRGFIFPKENYGFLRDKKENALFILSGCDGIPPIARPKQDV